MSLKVNLDLDFYWSITDRGEPALELAPRHKPEDTRASFIFDRDMLLTALDEDAARKYENPNFEIDEWFDLVGWLRATADCLETQMKESFA